ncbi:MAG TPA: signal peptide peptidase SppA [Vicinamibacterales bacterium]|nr:signal peptide peptidase SppA [Vicinamibacterales bacterium]
MALARGVRFVLIFIGAAALVSMGSVVLMYQAVSRGPSVPASATLVLRPGGDLQEVAPYDVVGQLFGREPNTVRAFVETLRRAKSDARIKTVLLKPNALQLPYWAKVQELRDAVLDFRKSGKSVVAFLEYGGDREYYLATAANQVFLLPSSPLDLKGVASYEIFLRGMFDKIGAYPDFIHIGDYKSATNQLTEKGFTKAHREMAESLNRDMYDQLVKGIAQARKKSEAEVKALLDQGPFVPEEALRVGLVDDLAYEDELDDRVPTLHARSKDFWIEGTDYQRAAGPRLGSGRSRIAVLYAVGTISSGKSGFDPLNGSVLGSDTMVEQIRRVRDDDSIKAIVLRIDSPGGSSIASDVIWRELMITRDQKPSRPLITSMSDLAASGGYYIALPGQVIVAQPGTLTGSIGIFTGKLAIGGTLGKIGVTTGTVTAGANADIESPFTPFTPAQRAKTLQLMQGFYEDFVEKTAQSRKTTPEQIDTVAQGRVWTGAQARENGLVDLLGGLDTAIGIAKERAHIPANEDVELVEFPGRRSLFETLSDEFGSSRAGMWNLVFGADTRAVGAVTAPVRLFQRGEPLALMPFTFVR